MMASRWIRMARSRTGSNALPKRNLRTRYFHKRVEVVVYPAVGMPYEITTDDAFLQHAQEPPSVLVVEEDVLAGIAAGRDVMNGLRIFQAQWSGRAAESTPSTGTVQDLASSCLR